MNLHSIDLSVLNTLYRNGDITDNALIALAPIAWIAKKYPGLISQTTVKEALKASTQKTCDGCVHFSSVHQCCMTRIDEGGTYIPVTEDSQACFDYDKVTLPQFFRGQ